jgi:hypothetical protein
MNRFGAERRSIQLLQFDNPRLLNDSTTGNLYVSTYLSPAMSSANRPQASQMVTVRKHRSATEIEKDRERCEQEEETNHIEELMFKWQCQVPVERKLLFIVGVRSHYITGPANCDCSPSLDSGGDAAGPACPLLTVPKCQHFGIGSCLRLAGDEECRPINSQLPTQ